MSQLHIFATLLFSSLALWPSLGSSQAPPPRPQQNFHLFVLAGQSNMAGRGEVEEVDRTPHPRVFSLDRNGQWIPAVDPLHWDKKVAGVGLGKTFATDYAEAHPDAVVGLIPCAHGGSPISAWTPGGFHDQTQGHPYDEMLARVKLGCESGVLKGVLWHQGESDANEKSSAIYETKLAELIDRTRAEFGIPDLPFLIGQLGNFPEKPWDEFRLQIDAAHQRLAKVMPSCSFVSSLGLVHRGDLTHFDSASVRELGHRTFAAYQRLTKPESPKILSVQRIWNASPHNAFTDLVRFNNEWYCVFREGDAHVSSHGQLRVLRSSDGSHWQSVAVLTHPHADLRDAKISVTPNNQLMLSGAGAMHPPADFKHQSYSWISADGSQWSEAHAVGEPDVWLWRAVWNQGILYGVGYSTHTSTNRFARLYSSVDGLNFTSRVDKLFDRGYPNESALTFLENGACYCLLRRDPVDDQSGTGQLGYALPPYTDWSWQDLGIRIGGPQMIRVPGGRLLAAVRLHDGHRRTSLCWVDPLQGRIEEFLRLPSGGDTSYAGLVWHDGELWVSYYSSHESPGNAFKSAIYMARVAIP